MSQRTGLRSARRQQCGQAGRTANGLRSYVFGALRDTSPHPPLPAARASPGRAPSSLASVSFGRRSQREPRPPERGGLGHQALLPPGAASSAQSPTWSCSASRLRLGAPTTCSALRPRKPGGREEREEREEETGSLHTPSCPPLRAARARGRLHCSSCRRYSLCLGCHLRRSTVRTRGAAPPTLLWSRRSVHRATLLALLILSFARREREREKKKNY